MATGSHHCLSRAPHCVCARAPPLASAAGRSYGGYLSRRGGYRCISRVITGRTKSTQLAPACPPLPNQTTSVWRQIMHPGRYIRWRGARGDIDRMRVHIPTSSVHGRHAHWSSIPYYHPIITFTTSQTGEKRRAGGNLAILQ